MARISPRRTRRHKGATIVIIAAMLPVVIGGLALSVDTAVIATARAQLSTAADAAALAGARKLADRRLVLNGIISGANVTSAHDEAIAAAGRNKVLGTSALLLTNASNANSGSEDVVVGYISKPTDQAEAVSTSAANMPYANTVKVTARRDASHSGVVPSFFSKFWNNNGSSLSVTSAATVKGFLGLQKIDSSTRVNLLPIVLDQLTYKAMIAGATTDQYTYNPVSNTVTNGADGIKESKLFPVASGLPGNWGTVNIGVDSNSTSVLGDQIRNGITPAQLATFPDGKIQLDQSLTPPSITLGGDPGISAGIKDDLTSIIGKPVYIPIYDLSGGNGNNATYRVVAFAPVRLLSVNFQGNPKYVIVQPAVIADSPTQVWGGVKSWPPDQEFRLTLTR
ncbi:MAG: pilus assembly protein TadG-related protein [Singulisphaera sp.]